ncbi:MAG: 5-oxoprolinase subunit PxpA [Gammaproteobacteria bacterium]|nr:5-oxoprolinase subunit PxpA [Gammaproteobacteria bacterium]MDH3362337.1 5-oxoprolinase subunit PxpA [Gammaproteobacteria bacterium]
MVSIDINADLGEGEASDADILRVVSSCNIACGGHAGDTASMQATVTAAIANGVAIGAHPSYPDREGFGRRSGFTAESDLRATLVKQIRSLSDIVSEHGAALHHVKPHGALYNDACADAELADVVAEAVLDACDGVYLVGPPNSELQLAAGRRGLPYLAEAFVDRAYLADGRLVPRAEPGAVHRSLSAIVAQAISLARDHAVTSIDGRTVSLSADTVCVHGDTPGAAEAARAVRHALEQQGIEIRAVG